MSAHRFTFAPQAYPGARIVLMLGQHEAGAIFPPCGAGQDRLPWVWRWWLGGVIETKDGRAKSELAAKNAILSQGREWLQKAGLE